MPYATNRELPTAVRARLPAAGQHMWRKIFNSAAEQHPGEEHRAFAIAWGAVKKAGFDPPPEFEEAQQPAAGTALKQPDRTAAAQKLEAQAKKLAAEAEAKLHYEGLENTPKRAREAASRRDGARRQLGVAETMKAIAARLRAGEPLEYVSRISTKADVETLESNLRSAGFERARTEGRASDYEGREREMADVDFAKLNTNTARSRALSDAIAAIPANKAKAARRVLERARLRGGSKDDWFALTEAESDALREAVKAMAKVPYGVDDMLERARTSDRLRRLGIVDTATLRAALREYMSCCRGGAKQPSKEDKAKARRKALQFAKIRGFFPTPRELAERAVELAGIQPGDLVLEPSAGSGSIAEVIREQHPDAALEVVEYNHTLRELLTDEGFNLVGSDFMAFDGGPYDAIVMNPPFEDRGDTQQVAHALAMLEPGGRLVAIVSGSFGSRSDAATRELRAQLEEWGADLEPIPAGTFKESGTDVSTVLISATKPGARKESRRPPELLRPSTSHAYRWILDRTNGMRDADTVRAESPEQAMGMAMAEAFAGGRPGTPKIDDPAQGDRAAFRSWSDGTTLTVRRLSERSEQLLEREQETMAKQPGSLFAAEDEGFALVGQRPATTGRFIAPQGEQTTLEGVSRRPSAEKLGELAAEARMRGPATEGTGPMFEREGTPPTILDLREKRRANRDARGNIKNQALDWRLQDAERAEAIRLLGWKPETGPDDRYAATTGEMLGYIREAGSGPARQSTEREASKDERQPVVEVVNKGDAIEPHWRVLVDGVEVAWATDPAKGGNPLADELRADAAKAIALRDASKARGGPATTSLARPSIEEVVAAEIAAAHPNLSEKGRQALAEYTRLTETHLRSTGSKSTHDRAERARIIWQEEKRKAERSRSPRVAAAAYPELAARTEARSQMAAPEDMIVVRYSRGQGITLAGPTKPHKDKIAKARAGSYGFRWSPKQKLWYVPRTRDAAVDRKAVEALAVALAVAGVPTRVEFDGEGSPVVPASLGIDPASPLLELEIDDARALLAELASPEQVELRTYVRSLPVFAGQPEYMPPPEPPTYAKWDGDRFIKESRWKERRVALGKEAALSLEKLRVHVARITEKEREREEDERVAEDVKEILAAKAGVRREETFALGADDVDDPPRMLTKDQMLGEHSLTVNDWSLRQFQDLVESQPKHFGLRWAPDDERDDIASVYAESDTQRHPLIVHAREFGGGIGVSFERAPYERSVTPVWAGVVELVIAASNSRRTVDRPARPIADRPRARVYKIQYGENAPYDIIYASSDGALRRIRLEAKDVGAYPDPTEWKIIDSEGNVVRPLGGPTVEDLRAEVVEAERPSKRLTPTQERAAKAEVRRERDRLKREAEKRAKEEKAAKARETREANKLAREQAEEERKAKRAAAKERAAAPAGPSERVIKLAECALRKAAGDVHILKHAWQKAEALVQELGARSPGCGRNAETAAKKQERARVALTRASERLEQANARELAAESKLLGLRRAAGLGEMPSAPTMTLGSSTVVVVPSPRGTPKTYPARFALVDAEAVIPSHDATTFEPRADYPPGVQERRYERDQAEQLKVQDVGRNMIPELVQNTNAGAVDGTPIIDGAWIALSGNGRSMGVQRHYRTGQTKLREWLKDNAGQFGLQRSDVQNLERPLVVRVISVEPSERARLVRDFNEGLTQRLDVHDELAAKARQLPETTPAILRDGNADAMGIKPYLASQGASPLIFALEQSGFINRVNRSRLLSSADRLSAEAQRDIGGLLSSAVLPGTAAPALRALVDRSAAAWLVAAAAGGEWDIRPALKLAVTELGSMKNAEQCLARWRQQTDIEGARATNGSLIARMLLELLIVTANKSRVFESVAKAFAQKSRNAGGGLFGAGQIPLEALRDAATDNGVEPSDSEAKRRCRK